MSDSDKKLSGASIRPFYQRISKLLGPTYAERLREIIDMPSPEGHEYRFSDLFPTLFPESEKTQALELFKKFQKGINLAAKDSCCSQD